MTPALLADAAPQAASLWPVIASVAALFMSVVGALVIYNLQCLKSELESQDARIAVVEKTMGDCKVACTDKYTTKEDWVRAEGYTRIQMEKLSATLNRMEGKLDFVQQLPEMGAAMGREIAKSISAELAKLSKEPKQ